MVTQKAPNEFTDKFVNPAGRLFQIDSMGRNRQFVFGEPLPGSIFRAAPFPYSGLAAIDARSLEYKRQTMKSYILLVERIAGNMVSRKRGRYPAAEFFPEIVKEMNDNSANPGHEFIFDISVKKEASLFPYLITDVARELDIEAGLAFGKDGRAQIICSEADWNGDNGEGKTRHIAYEINGKELKEMDVSPGAIGPVYDKVLLQAQLYRWAAVEEEINGDKKAAELLYKKAIDLCPEDADARAGWAALLYLGPFNKLALDEAKQALSCDPCCAAAHNVMGNALFGMGNVAESIGAYKEAVRFADANEEKHLYNYNLATAYAKNGQRDRAIAHYEAAIMFTSSSRNKGTYYHNIASAYASMGQYASAKTCCDLGIGFDGGNADLYLLRSNIYNDMGMDRQAEEDMRRYNELKGNNSQ
jgi:tetratricopeptide (TPR) repeat protein